MLIYDATFLPRAPTLANYRQLLGDGQFLTWLANSFGLPRLCHHVQPLLR